jgi:hypothetical protein
MSNLFTVVSAEQQEIVAGGATARFISDFSYLRKDIVKVGSLTVTPGKFGNKIELSDFKLFGKEDVKNIVRTSARA